MIQKKEEMPELSVIKRALCQKGDPNWVRNIYLRPSLVSIIETGGFAAALILLWRYW